VFGVVIGMLPNFISSGFRSFHRFECEA
jgi:hypothetical protein